MIVVKFGQNCSSHREESILNNGIDSQKMGENIEMNDFITSREGTHSKKWWEFFLIRIQLKYYFLGNTFIPIYHIIVVQFQSQYLDMITTIQIYHMRP